MLGSGQWSVLGAAAWLAGCVSCLVCKGGRAQGEAGREQGAQADGQKRGSRRPMAAFREAGTVNTARCQA